MRCQEHGLVAQVPANAVVEQLLSYMGVDGGQGIVQQVDVGLLVDGSGQVDPSPLPAAERDSPFAHDRLVGVREEREVPLQRALLDDLQKNMGKFVWGEMWDGTRSTLL